MTQPANRDSRRRLRLARRTPRHARRRPRPRLVAVLLAALGFGALLAYGVVGSRGGVAQAWDTKTISAHALIDHDCDDTQWHFVITQVDTEADAPATIHVTWANGNSDDVTLGKFTGGVAHYSTTANLDSTVVSATAVIYAGWSGQFNLSSGPCGTA